MEQFSILFFAFRYALGRRTYAVGIVSDEIIKQKENIPPITKELMEKEIREAIKKDCAGAECDIARWMDVLKAIS